jgi:D-alanyl-lipoteichoic acid acyltransferase DltB (MBOAT superfamily)
MLFNSYQFIFIFLPATLAVFSLCRSDRQRILVLALASAAYYAWWNPQNLVILCVSTVVNFWAGQQLANGSERLYGLTRTHFFSLFVAMNVIALAYFKYANFIVDNLGLSVLVTQAMPLGISFFTFQKIGFLADSHSKARKNHYDPLFFAWFVSFFPQLVAGPITHHAEMAEQYYNRPTKSFSLPDLEIGFSIFVIGLFKKVIVADWAAQIASPIFKTASHADVQIATVTAWLGAIAYTVQIYYDFSGYCDMATGIARMFGYKLPLNFNSPYKSASIIEFWRRWHITLSRFLRDYLYIPLGGNRKGRIRWGINLATVMLLGGLWHGANWTFVVWGGLHGLYLIINHGWCHFSHKCYNETAWYRVLAQGMTLTAVVAAWVFFRADSCATAWRMLAAMAGAGDSHGFVGDPVWMKYGWPFVSIAMLAAVSLPNTMQVFSAHKPTVNWKGTGCSWLAWQPGTVWAMAISTLFVLCVFSLSQPTEFIYWAF